MDWLSITLCITILFLLGIYFLNKWSLSYWKRKGSPFIEPELFWGNTRKFFKSEISFGDQIAEFYNEFKSRGLVGGGVYYSPFNPIFVAVDIEVMKNIVLKDFNHFINHGLYVNERDDPLSGHLFNLENERWRYLRAKLTPSFTSGKLKMMFQTISACTDGLTDILTSHAGIQDPIDIKDVVSRFTTDIIGSCAFGIECNSLKDPQSEFRLCGKKIFEPDSYDKLKGLLFFIFPRKLLKALHIKQTNSDAEKFFMDAVKRTVEYREKNNVHRKDFMHLLLQLKNRGQLSDDDRLEIKNVNPDQVTEERLTMTELAAQCFVFFLAGFETSGSVMTFALLELALNQHLQDRLRNEIRMVLDKHDGKITYEAVMEMTYLDQIINETLRKHPPFPAVPRVCNKTYKIPGTEIVIEPGIMVHIPVQSVHRDPDYYPDPDKFDPERFNDENKALRKPFTFLAFGEGPRICIGARFGILQSKMGILSIIRNFKVTVNSRTNLPIKYSTHYIVTCVEGDVWLDIHEIK